ncbi:MAG: heparan-alpha-glucosaminide N-acetyltransferase domain-containing protein [bacterium]
MTAEKTEGTKNPAVNRIISVDVMRTLAIALMVMCHFPIYLSGNAGSIANLWTYFIANHVLGDFPAAWFLFLMGVSQVLSARKREGIQNFVARRAISRGVFLFITGLVLAGLTYGPSEIWAWDILPLIGIGLVVCFFCRKVSSPVLLIACIFIVFITPSLRGLVDFTRQWGGALQQVSVISDYFPGILYDPVADYQVVWSFKAIITGLFLTGEFPILPWLIFPLIGIIVGRRIVTGRINDDLPLISLLAMVLAVFGITVAYASTFRPGILPITFHIAPLSFYPNSTTMIALQMGCTLLAFSILYWCFDKSSTQADAGSPFILYCKRMSRFSLSFYVIHYFAIFWPLWLWKFYSGNFLYEKVMSPMRAAMLSILFVVLFSVFLYYWDKKGGKFGLEWLQTRIVG